MTKTLLVADDALIIREMIKDAAQEAGWEIVGEAGNGQEGYDAALLGKPDILMLDILMPVMDGLEATRRLRAQGFTLPIIGVSAGAMDNERKAALDAGASAYVLKPVDIHTLAAILKTHLKR